MTRTKGSEIAGCPTALSTFVDLLACAVCKAPLDWEGGALRCVACRRAYRVRPDSGIAVLLPDETLAYEPLQASRLRKAHVLERFAMIDRALSEPYGSYATFLNLGYVPNEAPQHAVRGPDRLTFNRFSTRLLFEVLGACDLDGRVILELGAGRGGNVAMVQRYYAPKTIVGVDVSMANVEFCQRQHTVASGGFVVADVEHLPFRDGVAGVILNLESSHYYPDIERFFEDAHRVLARGGDFLYADVLPARTFEAVGRCLDRLGFELTREQDISRNVLLSCTEIARIRDSRRTNGIYGTFTVIPGSAEFESLRSGDTPYKIITLRKP